MEDKKNKYIYGRLYENCIDNESKTNARGFIRRKDRVKIILLVLSFFIFINYYFFIFHKNYFSIFLVLSILMLMCVMWITKTGLITLLNILHLNRIRRKGNKNIFDLFFVHINMDGNHVPINDKHLRVIKENPIFWTKITLVFSDILKNKYLVLISKNKIRLKIKIINKENFEVEHIVNEINSRITTEVKEIYSISEFIEFIRNIYKEATNKVIDATVTKK